VTQGSVCDDLAVNVEQNTRFGLDIRRTASEYRFCLRLSGCLLVLESYALVDVTWGSKVKNAGFTLRSERA
jgi:hypothetical protein